MSCDNSGTDSLMSDSCVYVHLNSWVSTFVWIFLILSSFIIAAYMLTNYLLIKQKI